MAKYRQRELEVEATQWFKNGDHPQDECERFVDDDGRLVPGEGRVVRYYRHPRDDGERVCLLCRVRMHEHGWLDTPDGNRVVCPGDFVVVFPGGQRDARFALKPALFAAVFDVDHQ